MRKYLLILFIFIAIQSFGQKGILAFVERNFIDPYLLLGNQYYAEENYDSALIAFSVPIQILRGKHPKHINNTNLIRNHHISSFQKSSLLFLKLGQVYYFLGNNWSSLLFLKNTEALLQQKKDSSYKSAKCFYFLGLAYSNNNNYTLSLEYYLRSLVLYSMNGYPDGLEEGFIYANIGNIYGNQENYNKALEFYNKSLGILQTQSEIKKEKTSIIVNNIGSIHYAQGNYFKAKQYYLLAIELLENSGVPVNTDLSMYYNNLGGIFSYLENYDSAEICYHKSLKIRNILLPNEHISKGHSYLQLGIVMYNKHDYDKAFEWVEKSININSYQFGYNQLINSNSFQNVIDFNLMASSLLLKIQVLQSQYLSNKNERIYNQTILAIKEFLSYYDYYNIRLINHESYFLNSDIFKEGISSAIDFYFHINQDSNYRKNMLFHLMECGKSIKLFQSIIEADAKKKGNIPDSIMIFEQGLKQRITENEVRLSIAKEANLDINNLDRYYMLIKERANLYSVMDSLKSYLDSKYESYKKLKSKTAIVDIQNVQERLGDSIAIIEFYCGDSTMYISLITKSIFCINSRNKELIQNISVEHLKNIKFYNNTELQKTGYNLYLQLIEPFKLQLSNIKKIIFIPDEFLYYIPFETLVTTNQKITSQPEYLIKKYEVCYQFSCSIWKLAYDNKQNDTISKYSFLGFAPFSEYSTEEGEVRYNTPLPHSRTELNYISNYFLQNDLNSLLYFQYNATKNNLLKNCSRFSHIHLATHGIFNDKNPELSKIQFSIHDPLFNKEKINSPSCLGDLYLSESYNLNLNAALVVLSSCKSGMGKLIIGEGMISMCRGFFYSGAKNVLFSLWNIQDKTSYALFDIFYKYLLLGSSPETSLRKAKIELINNDHTSLPIFWSGYLLLGS